MLTGGEQQRKRAPMLFTRQMQFRRPPTPRTPQRVIDWFDHDTTGELDLLVTVAAGAGGVLMRPHDGRIDADVPDDLASGIGDRLKPGQDLRPHPRRVAGGGDGTARTRSARVCSGPGRPARARRHGCTSGFRR